MTNIGKPYEGKPHVRFDEEGLASQPFTLAKSRWQVWIELSLLVRNAEKRSKLTLRFLFAYTKVTIIVCLAVQIN